MEADKRTRRDQIAERARVAFANHVLTCEQNDGPVRMWYCAKPGTSMYSFRVIEAPGTLVVAGDVGSVILHTPGRRMVPWLLSSWRSLDYVLEKIHGGRFEHLEFIQGEVESFLQDQIKTDSDLDGDAGEVERLLAEWNERKVFTDEHSLPELAYEILCGPYDSEVMSGLYDFGSDVLWSYHAIARFAELLGQETNSERDQVQA